MDKISALLLVVMVLLTLVNLGLVGLNLKLYTEYFKDKAQDRRIKNKGE